MNVPEDLWRVKIDGVPESVRPVVEKYLLNFRTMAARGAGLVLGGQSGVGKSAIAALILKEARSLGYTSYFGVIWEVRECVRNRVMFDDSMTVLDRCREVDVLVLDGVKVEDAAERAFSLREIEDLLSVRCLRKRVSIITTRLSDKDYLNKTGSLALTVRGSMMYLKVEGPDKREQQDQDLCKVILG
jgi:DNA replication protein DnaC